MKKCKQLTLLLAAVILLFSCNKDEEMSLKSNFLPEVSNTNIFVELMLKASINNNIVESIHSEAVYSASKGLDESVYLEEILNTEDAQTKSECTKSILKNYFVENYSQVLTKASDEESFSINDVEIYWPYCENWDGVSQPVIVINTYDDSQFIEDDKVYAYKIIENDNEYSLDTLIVDEAYAMKNPVWVINKSDVSLEEIINLTNGNSSNTSILPSSPLSKSLGYVSETEIVSIQATQHHDPWLEGASEFMIYWFHPDFTCTDSIRVNKSGQFKIKRADINNKNTINIAFTANFDWTSNQSYNRLKVIELDNGNESITIPIELAIPIGEVPLTLKTSITVTNNDDMIMEYNIPRQSMFTAETQIDENHYQRSFWGAGVTLESTLTKVAIVSQ